MSARETAAYCCAGAGWHAKEKAQPNRTSKAKLRQADDEKKGRQTYHRWCIGCQSCTIPAWWGHAPNAPRACTNRLAARQPPSSNALMPSPRPTLTRHSQLQRLKVRPSRGTDRIHACEDLTSVHQEGSVGFLMYSRQRTQGCRCCSRLLTVKPFQNTVAGSNRPQHRSAYTHNTPLITMRNT